MKLVLLSLCLSAATATPIPTTPVSLIDFKASDIKVPVNVMGWQTEKVDALNKILSGNKASHGH